MHSYSHQSKVACEILVHVQCLWKLTCPFTKYARHGQLVTCLACPIPHFKIDMIFLCVLKRNRMLKSYKISLVCTFMKTSWKESKLSFKKHVSSVITILQRVFFLAVDKLIWLPLDWINFCNIVCCRECSRCVWPTDEGHHSVREQEGCSHHDTAPGPAHHWHGRQTGPCRAENQEGDGRR